MSKIEKLNEEQVFKQELDDDELGTVSGGGGKSTCGYSSSKKYSKDKEYGCTEKHYRNIYEGGFPNCAATVEEGSLCDENDGCYSLQVVYEGMSFFDCRKAWE